MDCQQYHIMEVTQRALDDAGIPPERIPQNTAVYMSMRMGDMIITNCENRNIPNNHMLTGGSHTTAANRVSFFYNIRGGSMGVAGACSSSMTGIHFGVWSLWNHECDAVIAGGVNFSWCPHDHLCASHHQYLSETGEARPFDSAADGRVRAEGAGVVILKPLDDAIRDGDHVHCVIRGSSLNYHGNNGSITLHSVSSFKLSMNTVYHRFGIPLSKVDYIEAHATGNGDEDVIECKAIAELFGADKSRGSPVKVGSVKANIGHTELAAGAVSVIKAALMLSNSEYYRQVNFDTLNPELSSSEGLFKVQKTYSKHDEKSMLIGVNTTSLLGQQCHMVLEKYNAKEKHLDSSQLAGWKFGCLGEKGKFVALPLSAKTRNALIDMARLWIEYESAEDANVVAGWMGARMPHYPYRVVFLADSAEDIKLKLKKFVCRESDEHIIEGKVDSNFKVPQIGFVFPGQGQQWWHMGRQLYANQPVYKNIINKCDRVWKESSGFSFLEKNKTFVSEGYEEIDPVTMDDTLTSLIAIVSNQMAMYALLVHWGIKPDLVVGHSLGEIASVYATGGMDLEACISNAFIRATAQAKVAGTGTMAAARMSQDEAVKFVSQYEDIFVSCLNSPGNVTLGGGKPIVKKLCNEFPTKLKEIRVLSAFHTSHMDSVKDNFVGGLQKIYVEDNPRNGIGLYTSAHGDTYDGTFCPDFWWKNLRGTVNFVGACQSIFRDYKSNVLFMEVGASATLLGTVRQTAQTMGCSTQGLINTGIRNKNDQVSMLRSVATAHVMGLRVDWNNLTNKCVKYVQVPAYPYQGNYYRLESDVFRKRRLGQFDRTYKGLLGIISIENMPYLEDYNMNGEYIMPASSYIEYMAELAEEDKVYLKNINIHQSVVIPQRLPNYGHESVSLQHLVDGRHVSIINRGDKSLHSTAVFGKAARDGDDDRPSLDVDVLEKRCNAIISHKQLYNIFDKSNLTYGPSFQLVKRVRVSDGEAVGYIVGGIGKMEILQATTLDAIFQVALAAFGRGTTYKVHAIKSLKTYIAKMPFQEHLIVHARLTRYTLESFGCDLSVADKSGHMLLVIHDCTFKIDSKIIASLEMAKCVYEINNTGVQDFKKIEDGQWIIVSEIDGTISGEGLRANLPNEMFMCQEEFNDYTYKSPSNIVYILKNIDEKSKKQNVKKNMETLRNLFESLKDKDVALFIILCGAEKDVFSSCVLDGYCRYMTNKLAYPKLRTMVIDIGDKLCTFVCSLVKGKYLDDQDVKEFSMPVIQRFDKFDTPEYTGEWSISNGPPPVYRTLNMEHPKNDEICIRVKSVCKAVPDFMQCAGVVEEIGSNVTSVSAGDDVVALAVAGMSSVVKIQQEFVVSKPVDFDWKQASTFGLTFAVVYHALHDVIRVSPGNTMYVVNAESTMGQAVVNLGKLMGASIICCGNPTTLAELFGVITVVNENSLHSSKQIRQHTGAEGLDFVICPNGEQCSKKLVDCMKYSGKIGIITYDRQDIQIDPRVMTCVINGIILIKRQPERYKTCYYEAAALIGRDCITTPLKSSATLKNIVSDKLVSIAIPDEFIPDMVSYGNISMRDDVTYILTDCSSDFTMELGGWLFAHGARYLAIISKHTTKNIFHEYTKQWLEEHGCTIFEIQCNLEDQCDVADLFVQLKEVGAPEVKGVFHLSLNLDDITKDTEEAMDRLLGSQAVTAYNLHLQTQHMNLDHFVIVSHISGWLGNPLTPGLALSSQLMDHLAQDRLTRGLQALSLHVGILADLYRGHQTITSLKALEAIGSKQLPTAAILEVLDTLLQIPDRPAVMAFIDQVRHYIANTIY